MAVDSSLISLKRTSAFLTMYRAGRWVHGPALSIGVLKNAEGTTRIGLRTRRGLKGAVERNRLKRQLRAIVHQRDINLRVGLDVVIVAHPSALPANTNRLRTELLSLCKRLNILS
ncbi:MAG: ribonuclease P protein component [Candidatus Omnitrophota bacterium]|nr:ribonuclease P protein component [Candidatus Omnitrophota bacterium]